MIIVGRRAAAAITGDAGVMVPVVVRVVVCPVVPARVILLVHRRPSFRVMTSGNLPMRTV